MDFCPLVAAIARRFEEEFSHTNVGVRRSEEKFSHTNVGVRRSEEEFSQTNVGVRRSEEKFSHTNVGVRRSEEKFSHTNVGVRRSEEEFSHTNVGVRRLDLRVRLFEVFLHSLVPSPWFVSHETLFHYIYLVNTQIRKSYTELNKIYFWTATIHDWLSLLEPEENKKVIIGSLKKLSDDKL